MSLTHNNITHGSFTGPHPSSIKLCEWVDDMKRWPQTESAHIMSYLIKSEACDFKDMDAFRSLESYNYLISGWVGQVMIYDASQNVYYLKADVTPSQSLSELPHSAWVCVRKEGDVLTAGCSCMAGLGKVCSHAAAILWKIDMANRKGLTGIACTDESANWNRGTKRNLEPGLIKDLLFKKAKPSRELEMEKESAGQQTVPQQYSHGELLQHYEENAFTRLSLIPGTVLNKIANANVNTSSILNMRTRGAEDGPSTQNHNHEYPNDLPYRCPPCMRFYNDMICVSETQISKLSSVTVAQAHCDLWIESRKLRITASTASKVPKTEKGNPLKFLFSKVYKPFSGNANTRYGIQMEATAVQCFIAKTGLPVQKSGSVVAKTDNWLSASPDGLVGSDAILEVKCPVPKTFVPSHADMLFSDGSFSLNPKGSRGYYCQVQLTMYCTSRKKCYFFVWLSNSEDYVLEIDFDENYVLETVHRLRTFYFTKMLPMLVDDTTSKLLVISETYKKFMDEV